MKIFEADYFVNGEIRFEGGDYDYIAQIDQDHEGNREYYIEIREHGLDSEKEDAIEKSIIKELEKCKLKFEK